MSKSTRQKSSNPNYEVGYGRPPVATQFPPKTSGNPRGRPPKAKGPRKKDATDGLSAVQRAVLDAGAAKVEVRRGRRMVKMTQLEAAVEGLAEAARNGNVRVICPLLGGPKSMLFWTRKGKKNAIQETHAGGDYRQAA